MATTCAEPARTRTDEPARRHPTLMATVAFVGFAVNAGAWVVTARWPTSSGGAPASAAPGRCC